MKKIFLFITMLLVFVVSCGKEFYVDVENNGKVPTIELKKFDGKVLKSDEIFKNGKPTLFIVVAEWCPHCKAEAPYIEEFYNKYKDKVNVVVVYSNVNTDLEKSEKYIKDNGYTYPTYYDGDGKILRGFGVQGFPFNVRIDNGKVTKVLEPPVDLEKLEIEFIK